jgi:hypothetical protein
VRISGGTAALFRYGRDNLPSTCDNQDGSLSTNTSTAPDSRDGWVRRPTLSLLKPNVTTRQIDGVISAQRQGDKEKPAVGLVVGGLANGPFVRQPETAFRRCAIEAERGDTAR